MTDPLLVHASCVCAQNKGILLVGPSGAGKSDLALRLIDRGAMLVADDYVNLSRKDDVLMASPPGQLTGKIEVRGVGIFTLPFAPTAQIHLYVDLANLPERLPEPSFHDIAGVMIPKIALSAWGGLSALEDRNGTLKGHRPIMNTSGPERILLVTGMSGAGKSTVLDTLEDMGWEVVDNLPFQLLDRLLATRAPAGTMGERPLALGIDSRTRGFDADQIVARVNALPSGESRPISMLFVDCAGSELERRYSETRRRHPLAADRPAKDGIASERELVAPLRRWAEHVIDTTASTTNALKQEIRTRFGDWGDVGMNISVMSFGYARGLPRNADLVFDMRFLRNPHWDTDLRPLTGLDADVSQFIQADPAYEDVIAQIQGLLLTLLPRYGLEGKAYVTIAFGCTGGRHRSVHVAERVARHLANQGFTPILSHRDIEAAGDRAGKEDESGAQASPTQ